MAVGLHGSDVFMAEKRRVRAAWSAAPCARCSFLTGCSPELVDRVCASAFPASSAAVIPYGVDVETFSPGAERREDWRQRLGIPHRRRRCSCRSGRMVTKKGYQVLLRAAAGAPGRSHAKLHLVLRRGRRPAGGVSARQPGRGAIASTFPGSCCATRCPISTVRPTLFVLPAVHDAKGNVDGLPNVILEAMASGLPVVASGISGIPLAITDGREGRLVAEREPAELAAAGEELVADAPQRRRMGAAPGQGRAELTWRAVAGRYRAAYEDALR